VWGGIPNLLPSSLCPLPCQRSDFQIEQHAVLTHADQTFAGNGSNRNIAAGSGETAGVENEATKQHQGFTCRDSQVTRVEETARRSSVKGKLVGSAAEGSIVVGASGVEPAAGEADAGGGGGSKGADNIQTSIGAKNNAAGIHQKQIGVATADPQQPVDSGGAAARDSAQDITQGRIGQEVSYLAGVEAKFLETVEQVLAVARETAAVDDVALAILGHQSSGAIGSGNNGLGMDG